MAAHHGLAPARSKKPMPYPRMVISSTKPALTAVGSFGDTTSPYPERVTVALRSRATIELRSRYTFLAPLVDAEYGSATFVPVTHPAELELRVSTTGLLVRPVGESPR